MPKPRLNFELDYLLNLIDDDQSCVVLVKSKQHLALHPYHLSHITNSIKEILNSRVPKFDQDLGGILLGYQNIKLIENGGVINYDNCYVHIDIEAEFFVFKPEIGKILQGYISKTSSDHVACLVHGAFSISLPKPAEEINWIGKNALVGQEVVIKINFTNCEGKLPYIRGTLISIISDDSGISTTEELQQKMDLSDTEIIATPTTSTNLTNETPRSKKSKRKRNLTESLDEEESPVKKNRKKQMVESDVSEIEEKPRKKRKKSKKTEEEEDAEFEAFHKEMHEEFWEEEGKKMRKKMRKTLQLVAAFAGNNDLEEKLKPLLPFSLEEDLKTPKKKKKKKEKVIDFDINDEKAVDKFMETSDSSISSPNNIVEEKKPVEKIRNSNNCKKHKKSKKEKI